MSPARPRGARVLEGADCNHDAGLTANRLVRVLTMRPYRFGNVGGGIAGSGFGFGLGFCFGVGGAS